MQEDSGENGEGDSQGEFVVTVPQQQQQQQQQQLKKGQNMNGLHLGFCRKV